jgi:hypothetical protein
MPYGVAKAKGGDSTRNVAKMESCVQSVMKGSQVSEQSAIKICKSRLFGSNKSR